ncbi:uncharacterized protein K444DRAFT_606004 [Hyaloscypha bicolor E]|uniref:Secreted protein n=1 Tax=Hyaloscypha bicolor E TaxID=1095630 RepID=A0A2J6TVM6_9HELO|nr:uncharacterized protein K444DRAFT_606004 [Hyaloscypha bicolor E]PMD67055.1 hypothetical protein K444DRAFT_606004 [Hyaloscypha bicolor E]
MAGCIVRCFFPSFSILAVFPSSQTFASQLEHPKYSSPITLHAMVKYAVDTASQMSSRRRTRIIQHHHTTIALQNHDLLVKEIDIRANPGLLIA